MPIMLQKYAIMLLCKLIFLLILGHKNTFSHKTGIFPESSTSSPSLETVVNLVPEAKLSDRLLGTTTRLVAFDHFFHVESAHAQIRTVLKNNRIMPTKCAMF